MIRQAWLTLPSCFASSSTPTLLRMIFSSLRSDTQCLRSETTPPPSQPVRFDLNGYISTSTVHRIWRAFSLQPHRSETFKLSTDPLFVEKVRDIVGLYLDPPERALVLCVDEKSQIQALDRTQPLLPMRPGQAE